MRIGLGSTTPSGSGWRSDSIESVAEYAPVLALARARKVPMVPFATPIVATFTDGVVVTPKVSWHLGQTDDRKIDSFLIIQTLLFHIDVPGAFPGTQGKSESDYYFALQSGIGAELEIRGKPGYTVSIDTLTPINALCEFMQGHWPCGWVLNYTQAPQMRFAANVALPTVPATVTVTFCGWAPSPSCGAYFVNMSDECALDKLEQMGFDLDPRSPDRRSKTSPFDKNPVTGGPAQGG